MRRHIVLYILSVLLILIQSDAIAIVCPTLRLEQDAVKADLIFVGRVVSIQPMSQGNMGRSAVYRYRVDRVLKGDYPIASTIDLHDSNGSQFASGYDLVLLSEHSDSYAYLKPNSTLRIAEKINIPIVHSVNAQENLRWEILNSLKDASAQVVYESLQQTRLLSIKDIDSYVKPMTMSSDANIRALAFTSCIKAGMEDMVAPAIEYALRQSEKADALNFYLWKLLRELRSLKAKPNHLALFIEKGITSKSARLREISSYILRESGDKSVLPYLKALLDDSDAVVRYNAAIGFRVITGDHGSLEVPDKAGEKATGLIQYWKNKLNK